MNLIIEQGNSSSKVAVYDHGYILEYLQYKNLKAMDLLPLFSKYELTRGILSTVLNVDQELITFLKNRLLFFIFLDEHIPIPIKIEYKTPATLGKDRLAAVVGANYLKPGEDILVIDAGTAITYDLINAAGVYLGGNISPGMTTRFKALNHFTSQLPLVEASAEIPSFGFDTVSAIRAGVVYGIVYEMTGYIEELKRKNPSLLVFLTGGHSIYFERRLKNSIFADINLVLTGLNRILEYNVEN
ncbi:MAG: type III pantothenate kinase [Massilibacteroides sp.]|nr:type III pantothenate kinase [Massilibacteroides sp.]MDD3063330.1 type III pantothenate kinase [Massilibacteroides sp.]MDD4660628.1 type III pantothenate kinase [Massilibacteroides sp.]